MRLLLLGTAGCHLCEQAEEMIDACLADGFQGVSVESIDIAEQQHWQGHYAIRIPVLYHPESTRELAWPFNEITVNKFVSSLVKAPNTP
jgi:hypothetical protein